MAEQDEDDRPWTEDQWRKFMLQSDVRAAKFGELLETLIDHPDRDEIIAREMGWDHMLEREGEAAELDEDFPFEESDLADEDFSPDQFNATDEAAGDDPDDDNPFREDELEAIEAYADGYRWALKVHEALKPLFAEEDASAEEDPDDYEPDEDISQTLRCFDVAAKIAGGHGMGYEDHSLCGNIVCNTKSLAAVNESLEGLAAVRTRGLLDDETAAALIEEGQHVRQLVESRITELRSQVWWD
jgi:hypothetical protein